MQSEDYNCEFFCPVFAQDAEPVLYLLIHCPLARSIWDNFLSLYVVQWTIPQTTISLLKS